jgi:hypothetical protein
VSSLAPPFPPPHPPYHLQVCVFMTETFSNEELLSHFHHFVNFIFTFKWDRPLEHLIHDLAVFKFSFTVFFLFCSLYIYFFIFSLLPMIYVPVL